METLHFFRNDRRKTVDPSVGIALLQKFFFRHNRGKNPNERPRFFEAGEINTMFDPQQNPPSAQPAPTSKGPQALLPAAVGAKAAAERLKALSGSLLPEAEALAKDEKLKPIVPQIFGRTADGSFVTLSTATPEQLLAAIKRIQETSPEIAERIQKRLQASGFRPAPTANIKLPPEIKPAEDQFLASSNPATVSQRLRVFQGFFDRSTSPEQQASYRRSFAAHVPQLIDLLDRAGNQKSDQIRIQAVTLLHSIGSPYADAAHGKISELSKSSGNPELKKACEAALAVLKDTSPPPVAPAPHPR
jgi:hypothetical protein